MPRISRYNRESHKLEWVDATPAEHEAWRAARAAKAAATRAQATAPAGASTRRGGGKRASGRSRLSAGAHESETLEDVTDDAVRQAAKSAGPPKPTAGPLSPVLGLLSRFGAVALIRVSARLTVGKHPMTPPEAVSITAPALRIADRELGKRVKWTPKSGPNARDIEQIGTGLATYILRGMFGAGPQPVSAAGDNGNQTDENFVGGTSSDQAPDLTTSTAGPAPAAADDGDLFAGSEPVGKETSAASTPAARQQRTAGPPGAVSVPDSVWNQISPPERGLAEVMG